MEVARKGLANAAVRAAEPDSEAKALRDTQALREVASSNEPDPAGVEALLKIAEDTIDDERERGRTLDSKASSLVGFGGLILSLNGAVAKPLFDADLGSFETPVKILFGIAIASLLGAVLVAVLGVLRPQRYRGFGREELHSFATFEAQTMSRLIVHQRMLGAAAHMLDTNRRLNDSKARLSKYVGVFLAIGFIAVAAQAGGVGLSQIGAGALDPDECTQTVETSTPRSGIARTTTTLTCPVPASTASSGTTAPVTTTPDARPPRPFGTDITPTMRP